MKAGTADDVEAHQGERYPLAGLQGHPDNIKVPLDYGVRVNPPDELGLWCDTAVPLRTAGLRNSGFVLTCQALETVNREPSFCVVEIATNRFGED